MTIVQDKRLTIETLWHKHLPAGGSNHADDFFAAGGDSLGATRLLAELQSRFQIELAVSLIGEGLTIDRLVSTLEEATAEIRSSESAPGTWERI